MGAPRVLQAVARDRLFGVLEPFAAGTEGADEPRRALVLTGIITVTVLLLAGGGGEGVFNLVASIVTMFFLFTYGMVNVAAFVEKSAGNPSFRPRFRYFHWATALAGAIGCIAAAFLIHWPSALIAAGIMVGTYIWLTRRTFTLAYGDARRGLRFTQVRDGLYQLSRMPMHAKNWRPTMLVLSGNPHRRLQLVTFATWLEGGRGVVTLVEIILGDVDARLRLREAGLKRLEGFIAEHDLEAYPEVVVAEDFDTALPVLLQAQGIGPLKPNLVMLGWSYGSERAEAFSHILRTVDRLGMSLVVYEGKDVPEPSREPRIDLWWRGRTNGALMIILAHMLQGNPQWANARLRILRIVGDEAGRVPAEAALGELIEAARVEADAVAVVSREAFPVVLLRYSADADLVLMGLKIPEEGEALEVHRSTDAFLHELPPTLLVHSSGEADLRA